MLTARGLSKRFHGRDVLRGIDLTIAPGEVVGLIGHSGAGKSTLARCLVGLERAEAGEITLAGEKVVPGKGNTRQRIQYLWQDPTQSLSPFLTATGAIMETLAGFDIGPRAGRLARAASLLETLGLPRALHDRRPHSLSGGQCQRVALARALAAAPQVLILDEPLSSLDLATQVSTIGLLREVHADTGLAMLIVSHDLAPLRQLADRILVLDASRVVEDLAMVDLACKAKHPLARAYAATL
ncbi:MAG TPA: ABC transporter ATP-binding protein [Rhodobacteraceae bacterium]|nr:ABC transporter ATP-binding protein [Paracoccaceae bacterium]